MGQDDVRELVQCLYAELQKITSVQVIVGRPLEQLPARLLDQEVMIRRAAYVALLPEIADPGILLLVATADIGGIVGRGIIGDNQLEILVALAEQRLN
jgi:hypothetical protein